MNIAFTIPLQSLTPIVVQDLQGKYPNAVVRIEVATPVKRPLMDERKFWEVIATLDWGRKRSEDIIAPVVKALSLFSEADIFRFDQILAEKLNALDGEQYALPLGWGKESGQIFSVDSFLYARCCAVANGKAFYEKVVKKPALMPQSYTFEPILYIAEKAWRMKTGSGDYDFLPSVSYETFSNPTGWKDMPSFQDLVFGNSL